MRQKKLEGPNVPWWGVIGPSVVPDKEGVKSMDFGVLEFRSSLWTVLVSLGFLLEPTITKFQWFNAIDYFWLTSLPSCRNSDEEGALLKAVIEDPRFFRIQILPSSKSSAFFSFSHWLGGKKKKNYIQVGFMGQDWKWLMSLSTTFLLVKIESYGCI